MKRISLFTALAFILLFLNACKSFPYESKNYSVEEVAEAAESKGIHAIIHGADHVRKVYVVSWSKPTSFFNRHNFVITSEDAEIRKQIATLSRGDRLFIKGPVNLNRGQAHIVIEKMEIKKRYEDGVKHSDGQFSRQTKLPDALLGKKRAIFYVHATAQNGKVIILEYGDTVVPMIVKNSKLTEKLYRGDYVDLAYTIHKSEVSYRATHIVLNDKAAEPVKVLDEIVKLHEKELQLEGRLVMFPKSPTINRNIFAIEVEAADKSKAPRYFTIMPKDFTMENFKAMLKKLQDGWDANKDKIYKGRNKYISTKVRLSIKGKGNVVSENQANPQIFADIEDITLLNK